MKRRNAECGKLRRPLKRNKITEGIYGSNTLLYLKFFMLWALVILADFILEFRFEFLWPFWLLLRSVYDSFKYQGLAFSVFFVCIALTSDMICFFFIPVHWLFFAASTYVWVQYVWHTEKGICLPTIVLWLLFVYIEAAVRLRDIRHVPFHLDLCRPFAAHCIGYPVVTLGFGFKSYVGYRMRQRKQKDVSKENEFYIQLLLQALPLEQQQQQTPAQPATQTQPCLNPSPEKSRANGTVSSEAVISNGSAHHTAPSPQTSTSKNSHRKTLDKKDSAASTADSTSATVIESKAAKYAQTNGTSNIHTELESYIERVGSVNDFDENEVQNDKSVKGCNVESQEPSKVNAANKWSNNQARENAVNTQRERRNKANKEVQHENKDTHHHGHHANNSQQSGQNHSNKGSDHYIRLEADVKRLKIDLQASRQTEQDLRSQVSSLISSEKSVKIELSQFQQDNDDLQSKLHGLVTSRQMDKQAITQLERRLLDERRIRGLCEAQLATERKAKKAEEVAAAAAARALSISAAAKQAECTESCRLRRRDLESEVKQLHRELKIKEERQAACKREVASLRQYKESNKEAEILMSALSTMQDKNAYLEKSLSDLTRFKMDLLSTLGEDKRNLKIKESVIRSKDKEIQELKSKFAQEFAVMPTETFCPSPQNVSGTSKLRVAESLSPCLDCTISNLDPNATAYTPKSSHAPNIDA